MSSQCSLEDAPPAAAEDEGKVRRVTQRSLGFAAIFSIRPTSAHNGQLVQLLEADRSWALWMDSKHWASFSSQLKPRPPVFKSMVTHAVACDSSLSMITQFIYPAQPAPECLCTFEWGCVQRM